MMTQDKIISKKRGTYYASIKKLSYFYQSFMGLFTGLTICVDDTWSSTVSIYDYDLKNNKYSGTFHFCIYDHFGVDENDVNGFYGQFAGFRAWYCLQHLIDISGAYTPLITIAEFDVPFEGETRTISSVR